MTPSKNYELTLEAIKLLLEAVGDEHWAKWIQEDIDKWRETRDVSHHLSAYGGMGSLNDVILCSTNGHNVTKTQEPFVQSLFEWLRSVCYYLALNPDIEITEVNLKKAVGRFESILVAFVGGEKAPSSMKGYADDFNILHGCRCLHCNHLELTKHDLNFYIAAQTIPNMVFEASEKLTLNTLVSRVLQMDIPNLVKIQQTLSKAASEAGITMSERTGWMSTCPKCKSKNIAAYRWNVRIDTTIQITPANDNLPLK